MAIAPMIEMTEDCDFTTDGDDDGDDAYATEAYYDGGMTIILLTARTKSCDAQGDGFDDDNNVVVDSFV